MAINFNGTTLSNMTSTVKFNGTSVSKVMFNGTEVWAQLLPLKWSGNSYASNRGISVSNNLFRAYNDGSTGAWITTQVNGTFTGASTNNGFSYSTSGNLIRIKMNDSSSGAWITYTLANKSFTGSSISKAPSGAPLKLEFGLQTSGGKIRASFAIATNYNYGAYISLN